MNRRFRKKFFYEYIFFVQFVIQHVTVRFTVGVTAWGLTNNMHKTYSYIRFAQVLPVRLAWWVVRVLSR